MENPFLLRTHLCAVYLFVALSYSRLTFFLSFTAKTNIESWRSTRRSDQSSMEITSRFQNLNWSNLNTTSVVCWDLQEVNTSHFSVNQLVRQAGRQAVNWSVSQSVSLCLLVSQSVCLFFGLSQVFRWPVSQTGRQSFSQGGSKSLSQHVRLFVCWSVSQLGQIWTFFLRGCTTMEWRNWRVT